MEYIEKNSKIIEELVAEGKLKLLGGMYDIGSGKVEFIEGGEVKHKH